jgi:hypothetical protein
MGAERYGNAAGVEHIAAAETSASSWCGRDECSSVDMEITLDHHLLSHSDNQMTVGDTDTSKTHGTTYHKTSQRNAHSMRGNMNLVDLLAKIQDPAKAVEGNSTSRVPLSGANALLAGVGSAPPKYNGFARIELGSSSCATATCRSGKNGTGICSKSKKTTQLWVV